LSEILVIIYINSFKILQYIFRAAELSSAIDVQVDYQQIVPVQERKVSWIVIICTKQPLRLLTKKESEMPIREVSQLNKLSV
jgi:hypothetical protein